MDPAAGASVPDEMLLDAIQEDEDDEEEEVPAVDPDGWETVKKSKAKGKAKGKSK